MSSRTAVIEFEKSSINLLGPFRILTKFTGLDCSIVAKPNKSVGAKLCSFIVQILGLLVIAGMVFRTVMFFQLEAKTLSLGWAEKNSFAFMGFHSIVCAFCVYGWTKNGFIPKHACTLQHLRCMRVVENKEMNSYSKLHTKCAIFAILYFLAVMAPVAYCAVDKKITYASSEPKAIYMVAIMAVLAFFSWLIVSTCLIMYGIVQVSMEREISYFNQELQKAANDGALCHSTAFSAFSRRQIELIKMVEQANLSLGSYLTMAPLFYFVAIINSVYITGFFEDLPALYFACLIFGLNSALGICVISLKNAGAVQDALIATSKVLMLTLNEKLEKVNDAQVYQTYQNILDRSLKTDTRLYVLKGFAINSATANIAVFLFPTLGGLLQIIQKLIEA